MKHFVLIFHEEINDYSYYRIQYNPIFSGFKRKCKLFQFATEPKILRAHGAGGG